MYIRKKIRFRLILLAIIVLAFIYWRGTSSVIKQNNLSCQYHFIYAVCKQIGKATTIPSMWDVLKAGVKF